jgi:enterochelin esterase family protein
MPGLLDAMIREGSIPPVLGVFISPLNRDAEYRPNREYVSWLAEELAPAAVAMYFADPAPGRHGLVGASLGGLIAAYTAVLRPDVFRLVGAQSPAFRIIRGGMGRFLDRHDAPWSELRFHLDGGRFEEMLHASEFLPSIRRSAAALREKGCAVQYTEVNEGHNWTNWRGRMPDLLTWLLAPPA